jgi:hypothetical protein
LEKQPSDRMREETKLKKDGRKTEQSSDKRNDKGQEEDKKKGGHLSRPVQRVGL